MRNDMTSEVDQYPVSRWLLWGLLMFSPWLAWKEILSRKPYADYMFWLLIVLFSIVGSFATLLYPSSATGDSNPVMAILFLLICPLVLIGIFYLSAIGLGALAKWLGGWLGGTGTYQQMQAVLIWSGVPFLVVISCWLLSIWVYGQPMLDLYMQDEGEHLLAYLMLPWMTFTTGLGFAEAHKLPLWKGLMIACVSYLFPSILLYYLV